MVKASDSDLDLCGSVKIWIPLIRNGIGTGSGAGKMAPKKGKKPRDLNKLERAVTILLEI